MPAKDPVSPEVAQLEELKAELHRTNQELRAVYENMGDGVLIAHTETRRFVFANQAICHMLGYTREELLRMCVSDIHPQNELPRIQECFDAMGRGEVNCLVDVPCLCRDGTVRYADIFAAHAFYQGQNCLIGVFHDQTERKNAEATLRASEERLQSVLNSMDDYVFLFDENGIFSDYLQPTIGRNLILPPAQFIGKPFTQVVPPDVAQLAERAIAECIGTNAVQEFDYQLAFEGGAVRWYNARVSPRADASGNVGVTAVVRDVTAHRRAERALEESERRFRAVIEQASDGIGIMDPEGNMLAVNRRGCEMFGFSEEEILRLNFLDTISASPVTLLRSVEWSQAALRSETPITVEVQGRRKDGSRFPVEVRLGRLELSERALLLFIARDVSERRSLERDVLYAAVRERERIGRELHDGIGQQLTGLSFSIEALHRQIEHSVEGADIAGEIARGLRESLDSVYGIIRGVMPLGLQAVELPVALQSLAGRIEERFGRPCFSPDSCA